MSYMDITPKSVKEAVEAEKPFFDFAACTLRLAAWFLAAFYVLDQIMRPEPLYVFVAGEIVLGWAAVALFFAIGVFLTWRYVRMLLGVYSVLGPATGGPSSGWPQSA